MCLLSVLSPGVLPDTDHLMNGACNNPDGFGFAIIVRDRIDGDRIEVGHGMDPYATVDAFDRVRTAHPESWALFHSRFTTDGGTTEDNCHPFIVGGDARTILAHNGVLPKEARPKGKDPRSDTRILAEDLIPGGRFGPLHRSRSRRNLTKWMHQTGYPNKIAILTVDRRYRGNAFILGEKLGRWESGVWHSNTDYRGWGLRPSLTSASPTAYDRYIAGEISFGEYLSTRMSGEETEYVCGPCNSSVSVDRVYRYCRACRTCLDCWDQISACDCWIPASARRSSTSSTDADLTPDEIDRALSHLPAEQAAAIKAELESDAP